MLSQAKHLADEVHERLFPCAAQIFRGNRSGDTAKEFTKIVIWDWRESG
jgi:hypothetical protein